MAFRAGVIESPHKGSVAGSNRRLSPAPDGYLPLPAAVSLLTTLFVAPLLVAAAVLNEPTPVFWAVLLLDLIALFFFAVATISRPALFIGVIVLWFALQRLVVALVAPHIEADTVRLLLTYKEGFYFILPSAAAVSLFLRWRRGEKALTPLLAADVAALTWLGLLALHFLAAGEASTPELTYARRFAAPMLLYAGGRLLVPSLGQLSSSLRLVAAVAAAIAVFGLIERFVFGIGFWSGTVDARSFYTQQVESGLLPENWTVIYRGVPDGIFIALPLEVPVRRLVSTFLEPTTLGSFLAFSLLLLLLAPGLGRQVGPFYRRVAGAGVCLLTLALMATLSRGGMLTVLAGGGLFVALAAIRARGLPEGLPIVLGSVVALAMTLGVVITTFSTFPGDSQVRNVLETRAVSGLSEEPAASQVAPAGDSTLSSGGLEVITEHPAGSTAEGASKHLEGLRSGLDQMFDDPLGVGLGSAGNWSGAPEAGGESTVGVVAAQLGVAGLLLYVAFYAAAIAGLVAAAWRRPGPLGDVAFVLTGALLGLFLVSFVSESTAGLLGNAPYFIFAGWMLAIAQPGVNRLRFMALPGTDSEDDITGTDGGNTFALDVPPPCGDTISRYYTCLAHTRRSHVLPKRLPRVTTVVLNWNGIEDTRACLDSLRGAQYPKHRIVVVDNGSQADEATVLEREYTRFIRVIRNEQNLGFAGGANAGIRAALEQGTDYVLLLNNDVTVDPGFLRALVDAASRHPRLAALSPRAYFADRRNVIYSTGGSVNIWTGVARQVGRGEKDRGQFERPARRDYADGVCMLIPVSALERVGLLDEDYFAYWEETDWCVRARGLGLHCYYVPEAKVWHKAARSQEASDAFNYHYRRNALMFVHKRGGPLRLVTALGAQTFYYAPLYFFKHPGRMGRMFAELRAVCSHFSNRERRRPLL